MAIAQEDLIGTLIPDVYIQGITLETSGTPILEDEPHTISERELASRERWNAAKEDDAMRVTVDLSVKESFDNDMLGSWFEQEEFWKYMKIKLIQTTDKHIIEILSNSQSAIDLSNTGLSPNDFGPEDYGSDDMNELTELAIKLGYTTQYSNQGTHSDIISPEQQALAYFKANTTMQVFNLASISGSASDKRTMLLESHSESIDNDGNTVHDFTFRAEFNNLKSSVSHLAYFAVSYMDFVALEQDYNLSYDFSGTGSTIGEQNGKVTSEWVIKEGEVVSTSYIFVTEQGDVWSGPIHQMPLPPEGNGRWMTKTTHDDSSVYLNRKQVPNTKVQDFRDVKEIERLQLDLSAVENEIFVPEGQTKILSNDTTAIPRKHFYFSDIWLSRDANGNARFMFAWDFKNFIKRNARYGKLYENGSSELRNAVLSSSKIHSLAVYRKRVRDVVTQNQLGSPWRGEIEFDKDVPPELIAISGEKQGGFIPVNDATGSLRVTTPALTQQQDGFKYFTGMDKTMHHVTDGEYQYGVVAKVQDGTIEFLKSRLNRLSLNRWHLSQYLHEGSKPGMTRYIAQFANPHIDNTHAASVITSNSPGHYDPYTNRFTKAFADLMKEQYPEPIDAPYVYSIPEYTESLQLITNVLMGGDEAATKLRQASLNQKLQSFVNPSSGNPQGVSIMIKLYDLLISQYARLVDEDVRSPMMSIDKSLSPSPPESSIATSSPDLLMEHSHWFYNHSFDSNVKKRTGMNYLDTPGGRNHAQMLKEVGDLASMDNSDGLKIIDAGTWTKRVDYEVGEFFQSKEADVRISYGNNQYTKDDSVGATAMSFLTPCSVHTSAADYMPSVNQTAEYNTTAMADILTDNAVANPSLPNPTGCSNTSEDSKIYTNSLGEFMSAFNLTTVPVIEVAQNPLMYQLVTGGALNEECAAKQGEPIDPHPAWNQTPEGNVEAIKVPTSCDPEMGSECDPTQNDKNTDYSDILRLLANDLLPSAPEPGNIPSPSLSYQGNSVDTVEIFDVTQSSNIISWMNSDPALVQSVLQANGQPTTGTVTDALVSMPNAVKALLLSSTSPASVNWNWHGQGVDVISDVTVSATFKINYGFLMKVEFFDGFGGTAGDPQSAYGWQANIPSIKRPVWRTLDDKLYKAREGKEMLCRLSPYELNSIGIRTYEGLKMPVYDTYFFIKPLKEQTIIQTFPSYQKYLLSEAASAHEHNSFYTEFISSNIIKE